MKAKIAVSRALAGQNFPGRVVLVAAGKAAWQMAKAAHDVMGNRIDSGVVVTKYDHVMGPIGNFICCEAGHPVPDENSFAATREALTLTAGLTETDTVLFLLSGGGSALFEKPLVTGEVLQDVTGQLLACGAGIVEINTIRKRLSAVKGGRFAQHCAPAKVFSIVLSDILGDPLDMIASGPAVPDTSTCEQAAAIAEKYNLKLTEEAWNLLRQLQSNLMCLLRGDRIIRPEGLNHVVVHPSLGAVMQSLGVHEFLQGASDEKPVKRFPLHNIQCPHQPSF